ncbi:MAG: anti-sigma regulatory factor [Clostridia bacterium]
MGDILFKEVFQVERGSFDTAGDASASIKRTLKKMGVDNAIVREVAISSYELELNLVIHSMGGELSVEFTPDKLSLISTDVGPGIPDIDLALQEGYSTAPENVRNLGFGAGMGLPNIKRHCREFFIDSAEGRGTVIKAIYNL